MFAVTLWFRHKIYHKKVICGPQVRLKVDILSIFSSQKIKVIKIANCKCLAKNSVLFWLPLILYGKSQVILKHRHSFPGCLPCSDFEQSLHNPCSLLNIFRPLRWMMQRSIRRDWKWCCTGSNSGLSSISSQRGLRTLLAWLLNR